MCSGSHRCADKRLRYILNSDTLGRVRLLVCSLRLLSCWSVTFLTKLISYRCIEAIFIYSFALSFSAHRRPLHFPTMPLSACHLASLSAWAPPSLVITVLKFLLSFEARWCFHICSPQISNFLLRLSLLFNHCGSLFLSSQTIQNGSVLLLLFHLKVPGWLFSGLH